MICLNVRCRRVIGQHFFGEGYCCRDCWHDAEWSSEREGAGPLLDPSDPTGRREIAANADQVDAMMEAAQIDKRLPLIIYLRRRKMSFDAIGVRCGVTGVRVYQILDSLTSKQRQACGLRRK